MSMGKVVTIAPNPYPAAASPTAKPRRSGNHFTIRPRISWTHLVAGMAGATSRASVADASFANDILALDRLLYGVELMSRTHQTPTVETVAEARSWKSDRIDCQNGDGRSRLAVLEHHHVADPRAHHGRGERRHPAD